jgi:hypothetical protein
MIRSWGCGALAVAALVACGGDDQPSPDAGSGVTTAHCSFAPVAANAGTGTSAAAAALQAGAAEVALDIPVGTALGGYTGRARALADATPVDNRDIPLAGAFLPSVGVETRPMVKAVALRAGGTTVVWLKVDAIFAYEGFVFDLEDRLGESYRGKILWSTSHSHAAWAQYTAHTPLKVGASERRKLVGDRTLAAAEAAARAAIAALRPARIGFATDVDFDVGDVLTRDRRGDNDSLPGGNRKDDRLHLIRIDETGGAPIAIIPVFGIHGTLGDSDNPYASTDATGGIERALGEQFDRPVVVMHVQSAGADTSPVGHGAIDCTLSPGEADDPCFNFAAAEGLGRTAVDPLMAAWTSAGAAMTGDLALSMVTRSIELGPNPARFTIRDGALAYAPFDVARNADRTIYDGAGAVASPIDEWNAPVGAALCESATAQFPAAAMPNTEDLVPYGSCLRLDVAGQVLGAILRLDFSDIAEDRPPCQTTRTSIAALRLGDYLVATTPGELSVLLSDKLRAVSPVDSAHTITVGYSQGHVGYMLTPEDWLLGGYEPSITFWGPLEAEYVVERLAELLPLAMMPTRQDGAAGGTDRVVPPAVTDSYPIDAVATRRGTVPAAIPVDLWMRAGPPTQAQPAAQVPRVTGLATFVWYGDDSSVKTPVVTLERNLGTPATPNWQPVTRRSGRPVTDGELLLTYAPSPLIRASAPQDHLWAVEWQVVPWLGAPGDDLGRRGAVPLGHYRFHVAGDGWTLASDGFEVIAGPLAVAASRAGASITVTAAWDAPKGFRLLDLTRASNRPTGLRGQAITVVGLDGGGAQVGAPRAATTDGDGRATIDFGGSAGQVVTVRVTDADGNVGVDAL